MNDKKINISILEEKLNTLTGHDFEKAEREERLTGNATPDLTFSKSFQARLAAFALDLNPHDIKDLPLKKYAQLTQKVSNFLFSGSETEEIVQEQSENAQSA